MRGGARIRLGLLLASLSGLGVLAPAAHANFSTNTIGSAASQSLITSASGPDGVAVDLHQSRTYHTCATKSHRSGQNAAGLAARLRIIER
jgi:hypothetical protein